MSRLTIKYLPLETIVGDERNPKTHDLQSLRDSYKRFGYAEAIVVDDRTGKLVAGHGRVDALRAVKEAGLNPPDGIEVKGESWLVPVQTGWASRDDGEAAAFLLASNRLTEVGGWDDRALASLLIRLEGPEAMIGTGFDDDAFTEVLARLMDDRPPAVEDEDINTSPQLDSTTYSILVSCENEHHQRELIERFEQEGLQVKLLMA